ncbi:MAG: LPS-assembly protein LptD [Nitrospira sp.]|nr:LPS-assembly protein LptD [Nitrospira sp.]
MRTTVDGKQVSVNSKKTKWIIFIVFLFPVYYLLFTVHCCLAEEKTTITSDSLEYKRETFTYSAKGNVKVQKADIVVEADEMIYNEQSDELVAKGNIRYKDPEVSITASRADLNLEKKTGALHDAEILFKKDNYHISGKEIEKKGENYYVSPEATFTTCDAPAAWCFKGKNIDAIAGDRLKARDVTFRISDMPVFYTPYLLAPITTERKTGLLMPSAGYSNLRGFHLTLPFFWAITENRDATFIFDEYTKKGIGEGIEYRYVEPGNIKGKWWLYHIRDTELNKDFVEFRALHQQYSSEKINGFLSVNIVHEKDYYREFNPSIDIRTNRFLESSGEIIIPFSNSRAYLMSQYWIDLKENTETPSQRLPEAGFVLHPTNIGNFWFSAATAVSNFWRDEGVHGFRFDVFPKLQHEFFGNDIVISQTLGLRETVYSLQDDDENSPHRESLEYIIDAHSRFLKKYNSFTHIVEPSLRYSLITNSENNLPVFDSTELFKKTSLIELSFLNRIISSRGELMVFRISQGFNSEHGDRPFLPLKLEVGVKSPLSVRFDADYDVNTGKVESTNSDIVLPIITEITVMAGHRYNRTNDISYYNAGLAIHPYKPLYLESRIWYDNTEHETKAISLKLKYLSKCWGVLMEFIKRPGDFDARVMLELTGISKSLSSL